MKTPSNTLDGAEATPRLIRGHDLTDKNILEPSSYFLREHDNNEISSNQIFNIKKKLAFLITLAIALAVILMTACDDDPQFCSNCSTGIPARKNSPAPPTDQIAIRSIQPSVGAPGSRVSIILENFNGPGADQHVNFDVTFGPSLAAVIYARYGMIVVHVPMDLEDGDYKVNMRVNGQIVRAPGEFKVIKNTN
jgi:hypothetical protein